METTIMSLASDAERDIFKIIDMDANDDSKHVLINDLLHNYRDKCMEYFSLNQTPEQLAAEREEDKIRFIGRNFASVYHTLMTSADGPYDIYDLSPSSQAVFILSTAFNDIEAAAKESKKTLDNPE